MTAFPLSEKELSVLVIVKKGHFFVKRGGGVVDCILLCVSCTGDISCDICIRCIDVTVNIN